MFRFRPISMSLLLCVLLSLVACASSSSDSTQHKAAPDTAPTASPVPQPLVIWHAYTGTSAGALDQVRLEFETAHPDIDVQFQTVEAQTLLDDFQQAVNAGAGPDLLLGPAAWLTPLAGQGWIQPLTQRLFDQMADRMSEPVARAASIDGVPYGTPFSAEFATLYYNKTQVTRPETYEDLLAQAAVHGWVIPPTFRATAAYYLTPGTPLMDDNGASLITAAKLESYLAELGKLAQMPGVRFADDQAEFVQGQAGLLLASSADYAALQTALGDQMGVVQLPRRDSRPWVGLISLQVGMFNINSTTQAADAAGVFLAFLVSPDPQRIWFETTQQAPVNPSMLGDPAIRDAWIDTLQWGMPDPLPEQFEAVMQPALDDAVRAVTMEGVDLTGATAAVLRTLAGGAAGAQ